MRPFLLMTLAACHPYPPKGYLEPCTSSADCDPAMICVEFDREGAVCTYDCGFAPGGDSGLETSVCPLNRDGLSSCNLGVSADNPELPVHGCMDDEILADR